MGFTHPFFARKLVLPVAALAALSLIIPPGSESASADTAPPVGTPATVSTDLLPTPQIDGVVWSQAIVGNTVYVGGSFTNARPAGSAAGTNTVPRANLLSYNLSTGVLNSFAPTLNGQVRAVAASPDGTRVYVGGEFTTVNGSARSRIAAFDAATGALNTSFRPQANSRVSAVVASNTSVFFGGFFTAVSNLARPYVASARASDGAVLPFSPKLAGGTVWSLALSPDAGKLVIGGSFTTMNGSNNPGYGLGAVNTASGANMPWSIAGLIRNGGANAAITGLSSDQDSVYGTGYVFGSGGNFEGTFRANWADGALRWVEDCHGDTYSAAPAGDVVYSVGHPHFCGNVGSFPETNPRTFQRGLAWTKDARTTVARNTVGNYYNFGGNPAPGYLTWWPDVNSGTFTGQNQGAWNVVANADYVLLAGEFTAVNNKPQQGLIRYAVRALAPNKDGPRLSGSNYTVSASSSSAGTARITWTANYDRDNRNLKYELIRNGNTAAPIYTTTANSNIWFQRPQLGFTDTGLTPGQSYSYRVRVTDPIGNAVQGSDAAVTVLATGALASYPSAVLSDSPTAYFRLGEASGSAVNNSTGGTGALANSTVGRGATGAINGDSDKASIFNGSDSLIATQLPSSGPQSFALEVWFKSTSTAGGKILGFGNRNSGLSTSYDRHLYLNAAGNVAFGVYPGGERVVQSPANYNNGQWHHVVANLSSAGMQLFVDGTLVVQRSDVTSAEIASGYWRIGGDTSWSGANFFNGTIDEVALYPAPLSAQRVRDHYTASGR